MANLVLCCPAPRRSVRACGCVARPCGCCLSPRGLARPQGCCLASTARPEGCCFYLATTWRGRKAAAPPPARPEGRSFSAPASRPWCGRFALPLCPVPCVRAAVTLRSCCLFVCVLAGLLPSLLGADWGAWGAWVESRAAWLAGGVARSMRRAGSLRYAVTGSRDEPHTYLSLAYESRDLCPVLGLSVRRIALAVLLVSHGVRLSVHGSCAVRLPLTVGQMAACCPWHVVRPLWGSRPGAG